jgi:hypothetical protein
MRTRWQLGAVSRGPTLASLPSLGLRTEQQDKEREADGDLAARGPRDLATHRHALGLSPALNRIGDPPPYSALPKDRCPPGIETRRFDLRSAGSINTCK